MTTRAYKGTLTGSYVQSNGTVGEILDPTSATDPNYYNEPIGGIFNLADHTAGLYESKVTKGPAGYTAELKLNTAPTSWANAYALKIYSAVGVELAAAAYPAAILANPTFEFEIVGPNGSF
jgi:hypothetical protein